MAYSLVRLAPDSYDLGQDGEAIAAMVLRGEDSRAIWTAELLSHPLLSHPVPLCTVGLSPLAEHE